LIPRGRVRHARRDRFHRIDHLDVGGRELAGDHGDFASSPSRNATWRSRFGRMNAPSTLLAIAFAIGRTRIGACARG